VDAAVQEIGMSVVRRNIALLAGCLSALAFWGLSIFGGQRSLVSMVPEVSDRVVLSAPVLSMLYGGDRFLAADMEVMRLAATGMDDGFADASYLIRAQRVVSELNPCHEDNYYLANGLLAWGGAVAEGNEILRRAIDCRFWDGLPAFFYGINLSFFDQNVEEASLALEQSAHRWPENAAALRKLAIMLRVEKFSDERLALSYLVRQRDLTTDVQLREMLDRRVIRLQGLVDLRFAQRRYESKYGPLNDLAQLVSSGELEVIPDDPLRLGYELREGRVELRKLKIAGMEEQP
jgi:HAMP domain-containing protein